VNQQFYCQSTLRASRANSRQQQQQQPLQSSCSCFDDNES